MKVKVRDIASLNASNLIFRGIFDEIKYIDTSSVEEGYFLEPQILRVNEDIIPSRAQRAVKDGTIIISTVRPNLRHYGFLKTPDNNTIVSTGFVTIDADKRKVDPEYLYYALTSEQTTNYLTKIASTAVSSYPSFNPDDLGNYVIEIPDNVKDQKRIVKILSEIEKKIMNNNAIISDLESMAKLLYDYWFVQFDFPDENGKPYKSSGGKMVWNDQLKREIPEGWEANNISRIARILSGGTPSKDVPEYWDNGSIPFFGPTDYQHTVFQFDTKDHITETGLSACASSLFKAGTVIITARGSIGKLVIVGSPMAMNQSCYAFEPYNFKHVPYLYFFSSQVIKHLKVKSSGSVFKSIIIDDIENSLLPIGSDKLIDEFCKKVNPVLEQIKLLEKENQQLESLRDFLLPMLMNGQVKVGTQETS